MKIKDNCEASSSEFWYDITNGYLTPSEILEHEEDIERVNKAIEVLAEFERSCDEQIEGFIQQPSRIGEKDMYDKMAKSHPKLQRGRVWCTVCGTSLKLNSAVALQHGWPKCCGYTMTIDSPEERKRLST